jgi:hypothetical protein
MVKPAIMLGQEDQDWRLREARITGEIGQKAKTALPSLNTPNDLTCDSRTTRTLFVNEGAPLRIRDGDPLDQSPAGDGKILMCMRTLHVDENARLTFADPAVLYVTYRLDNGGKIRVSGRASHQPDRGLTVIMPPPDPNFRYAQSFGDFMGSVYAPTQILHFGFSEHEWWGCDNCDDGVRGRPRQLGFVVGKHIGVDGADLDFTFHNAQTESVLSNESLLAWEEN